MLRRALLVLLLPGLLIALRTAAEATVPAGFTDTLVANLSSPTALAFTPDGRLLLTRQPGILNVYQNGALLATPALTFGASSICTESERGLLGVAVDPDFAANRYIYLFYTFEKPDASCVNRVSRFTLPDGNVISAATELVLIDNMPSPAGNHNAGDVHFGRDGYLYVTIGDGGCDYAGNSGCGGANDAARDQHVLTGKVLRITKTGGIPPDNPFQGAGTARCNATGQTTPGGRCQETFAWGLRNPFRMAFDPNAAGTRFFINDVGQGEWEEIDLGQAGADYGWNCREGRHTNNTSGPCSPTPAGMVDPIYEYQHDTPVPGTAVTDCNSITGGAFPPNGAWPGYDGSYLFGDFVCGSIFKLTQSAGGVWSASSFATAVGGVTAMIFGPHGNSQALYYLTYSNGGQVRRVAFEPPPLDFHSVPPCRAIDTRNANGPRGGPVLTGGVPRSFALAGVCGIPATARAVAINITVTQATRSGHLQLHPAGQPAPPASAINFNAGQTRANNAILAVGVAAGLTVVPGIPSGTAHLLLDVVGYFE